MKFHRINALLLKYYYITINRVDRIFDIFYWPMLDIFIWGFMTIYIQKLSDINLLSLIFGGIILWLFIWRASQDIAVFVLEDFWSRNLYNLFTSPLRLNELMVSLMIQGLVKALLSFIFLSIVAFILYSFSIFELGILNLGLLVFVLLIFAWALGFFISSFVMRYGSRVQILAWSIVWIIQPFSCVFYPLEALPAWAQKISMLVPTTYVFENMRAVLTGASINYLSLFYSLLLAIGLFLLTSWFFYSSFKSAKKKGLLAKNE